MLYSIVANLYKAIMTVTTNDRGQQNMWAKEPTMYYHNYGQQTPNEWKETYNGRWAMVGIVAGLISYLGTGKLFFGVF
jgi:hypothetical protein